LDQFVVVLTLGSGLLFDALLGKHLALWRKVLRKL
jgi:hypothetical protein